ncbi:hypothetical protein [Nocardioides aquiterrae]|uniref:Uncharacterized protein n=1 Tax=Nocardioides aquiterrae TaxID=203799 RepID=A0ABP4F1K0_9ACTN
MPRSRAALALLAGALAVGLIWWSPSFGGDALRVESRPDAVADADRSAAVGAEARTLAAAVLAHLGDVGVGVVKGTVDDLGTMTSIDLEDAAGTRYFVGVIESTVVEPHCQGRALVCRTLGDGTLLTLRAGHGSRQPALTGWAYRPDGSELLLEVFTESGAPSVATAIAILEDEEVGWRPSRETVAAGESLEVGAMELTMELVAGGGSPRQRDGELLDSPR